MRPFYDSRGALCVLQLHSISDIAELAVFKDEEAVFAREGLETRCCACGGRVVPVGNEVVVGFEEDDRGAAGGCEGEELLGCGDVGGQAEVGSLEGHETEEVRC